MSQLTDEIDLLDTLGVSRIDLYSGMGFVEIVDMMPRRVPAGRTADIAISRSARTSYAQGDKTRADDDNLVRYLMENWHTSPSESVVFQFKIRLPIFVERQLIRHRTARVNEQSFRYITPVEQFHYPELRMQATDNKQGSSEAAVPAEALVIWSEIENMTHEMYKKYEQLIEKGVAREVARCCLPVSLMTEMMWQMDLHNLMHFLRLRMDPHAQKEIRDLATAVYQLIGPLVPVSVGAFKDFRLHSVSFDATEQRYINDPQTQISNRKKNAIGAKLRAIGANPVR